MAMMFRSAALAVSLSLAGPAAVWAQPADPAVQRIEQYNQALLGVMKQGKALGMAGRAERFQPIVENYYDNAAAAALVVGAPWAKASPADKAALIAALTRHNAVSHASNYKSFDGERFVVDANSVVRGADRLVRVRIDRTQIVYRMRQRGGQWKIVDVLADGISQMAVQRADYASTVASAGVGGLARRIAAIDARTLKGR
jgi:phospholipid transport system substrate-binding protein